MTMKPASVPGAIRRLIQAVLAVLASASPLGAQVFWDNHSPAGITDDITSVICANGTFAATTAQGNVLTSPDGFTWTSHAASQGTALAAMTFGNGLWVAVGANGAIVSSPDFITWTHATAVTSNNLNQVLFIPDAYPGNFSYIAVGNAGTIATSADALNWTILPSGTTASLTGISTFIQLGTFICGQGGLLLDEPNVGYPFSPTYSKTTQDLEAVLVQNRDPTKYATVAVGKNGTITATGSLGEADITATAATLRCIAFGDGNTYVVAGDGGTILTSTDTMNWVQRIAGDSTQTLSTADLKGAAYSWDLQRFVVGDVSTRGPVGPSQPLIGGFVVEGASPRTVLIRADGPALGAFAVSAPLPDPVLTVYDGSQKVVATNTGWTTSTDPASLSAAAAKVGAFALPNPGKDSAVLLTLPPGAYTAVVTSAAGNSGTALFEAYTY
jgi:hypothetical protein